MYGDSLNYTCSVMIGRGRDFFSIDISCIIDWNLGSVTNEFSFLFFSFFFLRGFLTRLLTRETFEGERARKQVLSAHDAS